MVRAEYDRLSKAVSYALRHAPWEYELELDDEGWASVDQLIEALRRESELGAVTREDLMDMVKKSTKRRHELQGDRIRALYGHSLPGKLCKEQAIPPVFLYHGTARAALAAIQERGLQPMRRQFVHLSADEATAHEVGRRKGRDVVLLRIQARQAADSGVRFYIGNEHVWLADMVPAAWIEVLG